MSSSPDQALEEKYNDTVSFLYSLERFGILLGLENIRFVAGATRQSSEVISGGSCGGQ